MSHALATALLQAVSNQDFGRTPDGWLGGAPVRHLPSIDLALVVFRPRGAPVFANVLFSREHPQGLVAGIGADAGAVQDIHFDADLLDDELESIAWRPDADWAQLPWRAVLPGRPRAASDRRVVAPYPASLLKLMVAVGVGLAVDAGRCAWPDALEPMITLSDNDATDACVALLHRCGMVGELHRRFEQAGLATLQLNDTTPEGGWRNVSGAGVGHIHMTAWDTVRLLWLLDADAPPPPWLPAGSPLLQAASRDHLRSLLARQQRDEVLSSGTLRGAPGWRAGLPDAPRFAHKTGSTTNYGSDAGIVVADGCHYLVALLSNLGQRYAAHERCATTWRVPALGAALHGLALAQR